MEAVAPPDGTLGTKSFEAYLTEVIVGESHDLDEEEEEEFQRLGITRSASEEKSTQLRASHRKQRRGTPQSSTGMISPQLTEARSFVNGLLSPFSPLLKQQDQREEYLEFVSLQPCRKLSVIVRVLPCQEDEQRCLFPHVKTANPLIQKPKSPHDMVVVKPSAFGKVIPSTFTMETARLVAQVAHISSEDWARLYEFHHVMWPTSNYDEQETSAAAPQDQFSTMDSLSRAVVQDALVERQSSLLISTGQAPTCVGANFDRNCQLTKVIDHCNRIMESKAVATVSMVEIAEGKFTFRDLLNRRNRSISIRHVDMKGAVLEGLSQIPIDEIHNHWPKTQPATVVATVSIWDNAVSHEMDREPDSQITCVELSRSADSAARKAKSSSVSLGLALRQLLLHSVEGTDPAISFRESNITKILQRSLESSKIVLLASVSQLSQDYETTLATLNFLRSLIVKPGKTASSPFSKQQTANADKTTESTTEVADKLQEYAGDESILEHILADPRQRLAKIIGPSPAKKSKDAIEAAPSIEGEEDYDPIDYMQGLDIEETEWHSPADITKSEAREPSTSTRQALFSEVTDKPIDDGGWSMEEPNDEPLNYPPPSDSSSNMSMEDDLQSRSRTAQPDRQLFQDYSGDEQGMLQQDEEPYHMQPAEDENQLYESEGSSLGPESNMVSMIESDVHFDDGNFEVRVAETEDYNYFGPGDDKSQEGDDLLSLGHHSRESHEGRYEYETSTVPDLQVDDEPQALEISHEIAFMGEGEDGELDEDDRAYKEPKMWSELGGDQCSVDQLPHQASHELLEDEAPQDASVDESVITRESPLESLYAQNFNSENSVTSNQMLEKEHPRYDTSQEQSPFAEVPASNHRMSPISTKNGSTITSSYTCPSPKGDDIAKTTPSETGRVFVEGIIDHTQSRANNTPVAIAGSIDEINETLERQSIDIEVLKSERDVLGNTVKTLKSEIRNLSDDLQARERSHAQKTQSLESQLLAATEESRRLEKALISAKLDGDGTDRRVEQFQQDLEKTRQELLTTQSSYQSLASAHTELQSLAKSLKISVDDLEQEKASIARKCSRLTESLSDADKQNTKLSQEVISENCKTRDISKLLQQRENDLEALHDEIRRVEFERRQEKLDMEKLKLKKGSLETSLEEMYKEKSSDEERRKRDKQRIDQLESKLDEKDILNVAYLAEKQSIEVQLRNVEEKADRAESEARTQASSTQQLKERCQELEEKLIKSSSDKTFWEEQSKQINRDLQRLEKENRSNSDQLAENHTVQKQLRELEQKAATADHEVRTQASSIERLRERCQELEEKLVETNSDKTFWEEQSKQLNRDIERLEKENRSNSDQLAENHTVQKQLRELEQKVATADHEVRTQASSIERFRERCQELEEKLVETSSDKTFWEDQSKQLNRDIERLEDEVRLLSKDKRANELRAEELEARLNSTEGSAKEEYERLREKYLRSEKEKQELETRMEQLRAEDSALARQQSREISNLQERINELEQECEGIRKREVATSSTKDHTIQLLQDDVTMYMSKLEGARKLSSDLGIRAESAEEELFAVKENAERYRMELHKAQEDVERVRNQSSSLIASKIESLSERNTRLTDELMAAKSKLEEVLARSHKDESRIISLSEELDKAKTEISDKMYATSQMESLVERNTRLEIELMAANRELEESLTRSKRDQSRIESLSDELGKAKTALLDDKHEMDSLREQYYESKSGTGEQEATIASLKAAIHEIRAKANRKFDDLAEQYYDHCAAIDSLRRDNEILQIQLEKAQVERDAFFVCLKEGKKKMGAVIKKGEVGKSCLEVFARAEAAGETNPTLRSAVDRYGTHETLEVRAEQIVSCLAVSSRETIQSKQEENTSLRSRLFRLEEDKIALRRRISELENRYRISDTAVLARR